MNPQLHPLEVDPKTNEPFLRVEGHDDIIITPARWDDGPQFIPYFNDTRVNQWMMGPPIPYLPEDAEFWLGRIIPPSDQLREELENARENPTPIIVGGCPVNVIRKVNEDGSQVFIGACDIMRAGDTGELVPNPESPGEYIVDKTKKKENEEKNMERAVGDPNIIWDFGDYLAPDYHGRGIMTAVVKTIMHKWAIPRMNARRFRAGTFAGNIGSGKVFLKNGFKHIKTLPDHLVVRGESKTFEIFEWLAPKESDLSDASTPR